MMVGLQGSGKTTTTAKLAKRLPRSERKKVLMASLDVARPAAQEQLAVLGQQAEVADPADRRRPAAGRHRPPRAQCGEAAGLSTCCCSTPPAGSTSIEALMDEMKAVADVAGRTEILLVVDALTGQDAVNVAKSFSDAGRRSPASILTRMDGDARGGAALSMRAVTGKPIKFAGTGEAIDAIEAVPPRAGRRPHPRHGRRRQPGRARRRDDQGRRGRSARPRRWPRASSTSTTCAASCSRCSAWAGSARSPACCRA